MLFTIFRVLVLLALQVQLTCANTEKAIFLGPESLDVPLAHPMLDDLHLNTLSPQHWALRTYIDAQFPSNTTKYGQATWLLLQGLKENHRYEVRVCWSATVRWRRPNLFIMYADLKTPSNLPTSGWVPTIYQQFSRALT